MVEISITGNISEVNSNKRKRVGLSKSQKKAKADDGSSVASTSHELKQVGKYILHQRFLYPDVISPAVYAMCCKSDVYNSAQIHFNQEWNTMEELMVWVNGKPEQGLNVTHQLCFCGTLIIIVQFTYIDTWF